MNNVAVPFLDLASAHVADEEEYLTIFREAIRTGRFIGGPMVEEFESTFARYCSTLHCAGVGSGTDALRFALMASGIPNSSIVVTVANTFIATTEAITQSGCVPDFVDVDPKTGNMDPIKLARYLEEKCARDSTGRTFHKAGGRPVSAIVPVHLYGQCADMDAILDIAEEHGLKVIEDACQAHGAEYFSSKRKRWMRAGSMGVAAAFSFYPGKNLGAFGEAGAVTTNDKAIDTAVRMLRDHGQRCKYVHDVEGYNGRLDSIQAGVLSVKLKRLDKWTAARRKAALNYTTLLEGSGVVAPSVPEWSRPVYHLYVIRARRRDELRESLLTDGFDTGLHYPVPLHAQKCYSRLGVREGSLPVTEALSREILSLPMHPGLSINAQERVCESIRNFMQAPGDK